MKVKAFLSIEMDIDVSEYNEKYVRVRDLAIDLTKKEIAHNLLHHDITEDDFEYYIPDGGNDDTTANKITNELLICIITVGGSEAFKSFIDMRYALANKDWNTIKSMYGGKFSPWCSDTYIKDFDTALNNILPFANSCILTANEIRSAFGFESLDDPKPEADAQTK